MPYTHEKRKLNRPRNQRRALIKTLAVNVILHKRIKTTEAKAKSLRPFLERLVTQAKKENLTSSRYVNRFLPKNVARILTQTIAPQYKERNGGYLRIIKAGSRQTSDNARMAYIEFV